MRRLVLIQLLLACATLASTFAQVREFTPVTAAMLASPSPDDWLMLSRTYDEQRYSPLGQITRQNVRQLQLSWARGLPSGTQETTPLVHRGVMYVINPGAIVQALNATNGDLLWEYRHQGVPGAGVPPASSRIKSLALYQDLVYFTAPDGFVVALDARTGAARWQVKTHDAGATFTSAPLVVDGKVITGRSCSARDNCFIVALDAATGKEVWKFHTVPGDGEPGADSWGNVPAEKRNASTWGLPGSYDPGRKLIYWGIANPRPYPRLTRHGDIDAVSRSAPADLYSNSTVALNAETGKLAWYYQGLPGDDWDADHTHERILVRTPINPNPRAVKWINPTVPRGQMRDVVISIPEPGGIWALDRASGQFLWAMPFPYDVPEFHISKIDVDTGKTYINWDRVMKKDGDRVLVCFHNTRGYFPPAYHPGTNSLYIAYVDSCLTMEANKANPEGYGYRQGNPRPGSDPKKFAGIAKVNVETGEIQRIYESPYPGNGSMLATAGGLVFWGDLNRRLHAFDAESGKQVWETVLGGIIQASTITYAVNGRQYLAVMTGDGAAETEGPLRQVPELKPPRGHNAIYVFALPERPSGT